MPRMGLPCLPFVPRDGGITTLATATSCFPPRVSWGRREGMGGLYSAARCEWDTGSILKWALLLITEMRQVAPALSS